MMCFDFFQVEGGYRQPTEGNIFHPLAKGDEIKLEVGYSARACAIRFAMSRALVGLVDEEMRRRLRAGEKTKAWLPTIFCSAYPYY